jgi:ribosomal protein S18 acetylase RimI-like enzyme
MACWVVEKNDMVVGMALCTPGFVAASCRSTLRLLALFVLEEHRGTGVGSALLAAIAEHAAHEYSAIDFMVRGTNRGAQAFYSQRGAMRRSEWETWRIPGRSLDDLARYSAVHWHAT